MLVICYRPPFDSLEFHPSPQPLHPFFPTCSFLYFLPNQPSRAFISPSSILHPPSFLSCPSVINVLSAIPPSLSRYQSLIHHASFILSLLFICTFLPKSADSTTPSLFPSINSEPSLPSLPPLRRSWLRRPSPWVCIQSDYTLG